MTIRGICDSTAKMFLRKIFNGCSAPISPTGIDLRYDDMDAYLASSNADDVGNRFTICMGTSKEK